jgi:predicted nucleic acid-binding protein
MSYWDSSAIAPVLVDEPTSRHLRQLAADDSRITTWWGTVVECTSAVGRRERTGALDPEDAATSMATLDRLAREWVEVPPTPLLRDDARRLLRVHDLRAADAFQLAAARVAADGDPGTFPFVTLDDRLALAASREGFPVPRLD